MRPKIIYQFQISDCPVTLGTHPSRAPVLYPESLPVWLGLCPVILIIDRTIDPPPNGSPPPGASALTRTVDGGRRRPELPHLPQTAPLPAGARGSHTAIYRLRRELPGRPFIRFIHRSGFPAAPAAPVAHSFPVVAEGNCG